MPRVTSAVLIGVYALVSFSSAFFVYLRSLVSALLGLKASSAFFSSFNKASSDLSILYLDIPYSITFVAIEIVVIIGIMASVTWQVLIVAIPATLASKYVQGYYQAFAREIIRINGTTKAPVMNFAAETSLRVVTVRAFNMVDRFVKNYLKLVETDASLFFHSNVTMEWLIIRIETLQNLTVFTAALLLILVPMDYVSPD
ncbi:hypothetical protein HN51_053771 [Arachis hypogaea]